MGALIDGLSPEIRNDVTYIGDSKIYFRDTGIYIQSSSDGKITISADGTDADSIEMSGKTTLTGDAALNGAVEVNLTTKDGTTGFVVKDSETFPVITLNSKGTIKAKGGIKKQ